jgi:hypothetical protein
MRCSYKVKRSSFFYWNIIMSPHHPRAHSFICPTLPWIYKFRRSSNRELACVTIPKQAFPLPHYCGIGEPLRPRCYVRDPDGRTDHTVGCPSVFNEIMQQFPRPALLCGGTLPCWRNTLQPSVQSLFGNNHTQSSQRVARFIFALIVVPWSMNSTWTTPPASQNTDAITFPEELYTLNFSVSRRCRA